MTGTKKLLIFCEGQTEVNYLGELWNLAAIGTGVPNDWDSLIIKLWDR